MKKMICLIMVAAIMLMAAPVFAGGGPTAASKGGEKTLFQIASDSIQKEGKTSRRTEPQKVTLFETAKKNIESLNDAAAKAQPLSLRGNSKEQKRRKGAICGR